MKTNSEIKREIAEFNISFIRLVFVDIKGNLKGIEVSSQFIDRLLNNELSFDGSSITGFTDIKESALFLHPVLSSWRVLHYIDDNYGKVGLLFCDIYDSKDQRFENDSRYILEKQLIRMNNLGIDKCLVGFELEFYLLDEENNVIDNGGYYETGIEDKGYLCRKEIISVLKQLNFDVEASHHEVGSGQQEIHYLYKDVMTACENLILLKDIVQVISKKHHFKIDFSPKPFLNLPGNGLHTNISLWKNEINIFIDKEDENKISFICKSFIAGLLKHIKSMTYVLNTNPSSYFRLKSRGEAPCGIDYSYNSRSSLFRIINSGLNTTRVECRSVDAFCNVFLSCALILGVGITGIETNLSMPTSKRRGMLPGSLKEAYSYFTRDSLMKEILGMSLYKAITKS